MTSQLIDMGWKHKQVVIKELHKKKIEVGFLNNKNKMAYIASILEFGTRNGHIPERPYMRHAFRDNIDDYTGFIKQRIQMLLRGTIATNGVLRDSGKYWEYKIMKSIRDFSSPKNADSTEKAKGFNDPLHHYGGMIASVKYKIKG